MRQLLILAILCLIFPRDVLAQIAPSQPGRAIPVCIFNYAECPTMDEERLKSILTLAQQAISDVCLTNVSFNITLHDATGIAAELEHATSLDLPADDMNSLSRLAKQLTAQINASK